MMDDNQRQRGDNGPRASKWGPADVRNYGGRVAGSLLFVASLLLAADYVVRGVDSLASSVVRLCANHHEVCFWRARTEVPGDRTAGDPCTLPREIRPASCPDTTVRAPQSVPVPSPAPPVTRAEEATRTPGQAERVRPSTPAPAVPVPSPVEPTRGDGSKPSPPPPSPRTNLAMCYGTPALYKAEASVRHSAGDRNFNVTLKLTNTSDRPLIVFGGRPEYYGRLFDDTQANIYEAYAGSTNAPRPPGPTAAQTATSYGRRPEGGKEVEPHQAVFLEYAPKAKLGQPWRPPRTFTFKVDIWVIAVNAERGSFEGRSNSLSCEDIPAA